MVAWGKRCGGLQRGPREFGGTIETVCPGCGYMGIYTCQNPEEIYFNEYSLLCVNNTIIKLV